ncbi:unnamed protein product [Spodoptera littoralis]|uniref:Swiss Army Knife protein DSP-PTPase phosphatase domain-containing protein n=1 Tax=Spodoptera littoralis TaxID=7109 RepID=A0A9P0I3U1_SPOLI|nr:unnamed protein product [Spodoptera littoralis]CAH1640593.1 unnamed protein product [Spodoptera littoralis]
MGDDYQPQVISRIENITEQDDKNLAGATKEIRNELTVIIPENPFPDIEVDAYPPLKFSWVIPKKIAAMAFPRNKENLKFLINQGITHLVTLTAGKKPPVDDMPRLRWTEIPVEEFEVPNVEQIKQFIEVWSLDAEEHEEAVGRYFEYLTEDNPLRFGVSCDVMEEFIQAAKESTKKVLD